MPKHAILPRGGIHHKDTKITKVFHHRGTEGTEDLLIGGEAVGAVGETALDFSLACAFEQ